MAFFTAAWMQARRAEILRAVVRFQYQRNGETWHDGTVNSKEIAGTDIVVFVNVPNIGESDTITAVRVYDDNDNLAGQQAVTLRRDSTAALLRFTFPLIEVT